MGFVDQVERNLPRFPAFALGCRRLRRGSRESSPFPKARRLVSVTEFVMQILNPTSSSKSIAWHRGDVKETSLHRSLKVGPETGLRPWSGQVFALLLNRPRTLNLIARQKLSGQLEVRFCASRSRIVQCHRFAVARRLRQPHIAGNHGLVEHVAKILAKRFSHLLRQVGAIVIHRQEHALRL